jgi:AraC-like DNA-binding protein
MKTVFHNKEFALPDQFDAWQSVNTHNVMPMTLSEADPTDFTARVNQADFGSVALAQMLFSPHRAVRTNRQVNSSDPGLYAVILGLSGSIGMSQAGRDTVLGPGDLMIFDSSQPFVSAIGEGEELTETLQIRVPKQLLPLPAHKLDRLLATRMSGRQGLGAVVADTLKSMRAQAVHCTPADATRLGTVTLDLVTALLAHHIDVHQPLPPASRQTALLSSIEEYIQRNIADPSLTPASVAAAHHISTRYLHRLFEYHDTTVAALIRGRRLDGCRRDLTDPALAHLPIRAVAARWGFTQPADFSRAFTRAFGTPPSEYRRTALG